MKEEEIENIIREKLNSLTLDAYSIFYTKEEFGGALSITFFLPEILDMFLNAIDYKIQCDKTGYLIYEDNNTIILYGMALTNFINKFINEQQAN